MSRRIDNGVTVMYLQLNRHQFVCARVVYFDIAGCISIGISSNNTDNISQGKLCTYPWTKTISVNQKNPGTGNS